MIPQDSQLSFLLTLHQSVNMIDGWLTRGNSVCVCVCVYSIHACMVCLFSLDVLRQDQTQHYVFHMRKAQNTHIRTHVHTRTQTHTQTHTPLALIWCDRAVISALLTLWASFALSFHPTPLACDHRMVYINHRPQRHLFVCMCVRVFAILACKFLRGGFGQQVTLGIRLFNQ